MAMPNDTKERLVLQALQFFAEHDYERSSLTDIAQALGVTKGAIYHYFSGKDELFQASVTLLLNQLNRWFSESLPRDIPFQVVLENLFQMDQTIQELGESSGLGDFMTAYENAFYLFLAALKKFPELQDQLDTIYTGFRSVLEDAIRAAIENGEVRPDTDVEAVAYEITAFYEGALLLGAFTNAKDYVDLGPRVCASIWRSIAAESESEERGKST